MRQMVADWKLQDRVKLLGWQDQPEAMLQAADVVLLTSLAEGLPCADRGSGSRPADRGRRSQGVREVVVPGTGLLCSPKDPQAYARCLAKLIDDPRGGKSWAGWAAFMPKRISTPRSITGKSPSFTSDCCRQTPMRAKTARQLFASAGPPSSPRSKEQLKTRPSSQNIPFLEIDR